MGIFKSSRDDAVCSQDWEPLGYMIQLAHCRSQITRADSALPFLLVTGGDVEQESQATVRAKNIYPKAVLILGYHFPWWENQISIPPNMNPIPSQVTAISRWTSTQGLGKQMLLALCLCRSFTGSSNLMMNYKSNFEVAAKGFLGWKSPILELFQILETLEPKCHSRLR